MPPDVRESKEIRRLIIEKSEGVTGSEEEPFAVEDAIEDGDDEDFPSAVEVPVDVGEDNVPLDNEEAIVSTACIRETVGFARMGNNGVAGCGDRPVRGNSTTASIFPCHGVSLLISV